MFKSFYIKKILKMNEKYNEIRKLFYVKRKDAHR